MLPRVLERLTVGQSYLTPFSQSQHSCASLERSEDSPPESLIYSCLNPQLWLQRLWVLTVPVSVQSILYHVDDCVV